MSYNSTFSAEVGNPVQPKGISKVLTSWQLQGQMLSSWKMHLPTNIYKERISYLIMISMKSKCFPFLVFREAALKRHGVLGGGKVVCDHEQFEQKARDESPERKRRE